MRLFFAAWPPPRTALGLQRWAEEAARETRGKVTRAETIHLTLAFLGEVDDPRIQSVVKAAGQTAGKAHRLPLEQARYWKHNRIVWVGPNETPAPLAELVVNLKSLLLAEKFALEQRAFEAHVTLIRKAQAPRALPALPALDWPVEEFVLVRSTLSNEGSSYDVLERFPLTR
ncbi:MAG TPA: RNA 2',3'-cyclic phosphodiesterase [Burkholderiales bacterium]|nr:RNA 2',3'-cyclic phosphodiesterase [Burkholderiales bacterium]